MADSAFDGTVLIPGPFFHIDLSALDARHPVHYSRRLLIFRCASSAQRDAQLAAFKAGLQALVLRCPILGGLIVPMPPDVVSDGQQDWRTIVPDRGIELIVKDLRAAMASFEELEAAEFPPLHLPEGLRALPPHTAKSSVRFILPGFSHNMTTIIITTAAAAAAAAKPRRRCFILFCCLASLPCFAVAVLLASPLNLTN
jgi:hypothetical protein